MFVAKPIKKFATTVLGGWSKDLATDRSMRNEGH